MSGFGSFWARGFLSLALTIGLAATSQAQVLAAPKPEAPINPQGKAATSTEIVVEQMQMPFIQSNSSQLLQDALAKYSLISEQGGFPLVSSGNYSKGTRSDAVATLNRRLHAEGYLRVEGTQGNFANLVTTATIEGIRRFQRNHGIAVTGKLDKPTITEMNVSVEIRMAAIEANIGRLAAYQDDLTNRYIIVNVPAQQLEAVVNGRVYARYNVIVGRPTRPSPVVIAPLKRVKFNPYWNAPISIVDRDILPKLRTGHTDYLKQFKIKIFEGDANGPEVDPKSLDFNNFDSTKYLFREEPGPFNSMATAKIEFNSPFGIYLHDTPDRNLFNFNNRFYSSGCIRVQNVSHLINWILHGQDGIGPSRIKELADTYEQLDVDLVEPPELRVVYLTAWAAQGATVAFRNDIYDLDGSGFITGQPLPPGELTADGQRFLLKPLPRTKSVDELEADGKGFMSNAKPIGPPEVKPPEVKVNELKKPLPPTISAANSTVTRPKGLFDWATYRKKQAEQAKLASSSKAKPLAASSDKQAAKPTIKSAPKLKDAKALSCKPLADGKLPKGCPVDLKTASAEKKQ